MVRQDTNHYRRESHKQGCGIQLQDEEKGDGVGLVLHLSPDQNLKRMDANYGNCEYLT